MKLAIYSQNCQHQQRFTNGNWQRLGEMSSKEERIPKFLPFQILVDRSPQYPFSTSTSCYLHFPQSPTPTSTTSLFWKSEGAQVQEHSESVLWKWKKLKMVLLSKCTQNTDVPWNRDRELGTLNAFCKVALWDTRFLARHPHPVTSININHWIML